MLKTPMFTMYGGAGAGEQRQLYSEEFPVAYMVPDFNAAKRYAEGHAAQELPMGPRVTCVMESLVEGDETTGAPRVYVRVNRNTGSKKGEQWLVHPNQVVHLAVWFTVDSPTDWEPLKEWYPTKLPPRGDTVGGGGRSRPCPRSGATPRKAQSDPSWSERR